MKGVAPAFSATDFRGGRISPAAYRGRNLLLSFYRFASCPFCNLRIHELIQRMPDLGRQDLSRVAVFHAPRDGILKYVGKQQPPFPILPDPEYRIYRQYGVESALRGFLAGSALRMGRALKSIGMGFLPGLMDGHKTLVPADFLIGPDGTIHTACYGRDIADLLRILESPTSATPQRRAG